MYSHFDVAIEHAKQRLLSEGKVITASNWQGMDISHKPEMAFHELLNHSFTCNISPDIDGLKRQIKPNLPWADAHFLERVGRVPLNPGEQYKNWPFYRVGSDRDVAFRAQGGKFTHSYMERFWPRWAPEESGDMFGLKMGIRYPYGDLDDVVDLLNRDPYTRQAYLSIWFPEDTGANHKGRVPCTMGYHFMMREMQLHMFYPIRACDYLRHFRDDIYLASRLLLWVLSELKQRDKDWLEVRPGNLTMQIWSFHCFVGDIPIIKYREGDV